MSRSAAFLINILLVADYMKLLLLIKYRCSVIRGENGSGIISHKEKKSYQNHLIE